MSITVEFSGALAHRLGRRQATLEAPAPGTLAALLQRLRADYPDLDATLSATPHVASGMPFCGFIVKGRFVSASRAAATPVQDGETVTLMLLVAGG